MCRAIVLITLVCSALLVTASFVKGIGVNLGGRWSQSLLPQTLIQLLLDNGIEKAKLLDADHSVVKAFAGTSIELMVGIPNDYLYIISDSYDKAKDWVNENITKFVEDGSINIKYVAVGNEPFLKKYNGTYLTTILPAIMNIQKALDEAGHGSEIKATTPHNADVYETPTGLPSQGDFRPDVKDAMVEMVAWFKANGSPFVVNVSPFLTVYQDPTTIDFAFFDGDPRPMKDKGATYNTTFDVSIDTLVAALKKAGEPDLNIIIGEVGWPTDGNIYANATMASRFYSGLLKKIGNKEGTPLRPGGIEVYLSALIDEDLKRIDSGNFERHWGIYRKDGQPKFPIDFSGQGQEKLPPPAKGVLYGIVLWCVFNDLMAHRINLAPANVEYACEAADCTALTYGSSCNNLDYKGNISYAFNMYYQMNNQDADACNFNGLATLTMTNLSSGSCLFPIQIYVPAGASLSVVPAAGLSAVVAGFLLLLLGLV